MYNKYLSFGEALGFGWDTTKSNLGFLVGVGLLMFVVSLPAEILGQLAGFLTSFMSPATFFALLVAAILIKTVVWIGFTRMTLSFCDGQRPPLVMLFNPSGCFFKCIAVSILYFLSVAGAFVACILPLMLLPTLAAAAVFAVPLFVAAGVVTAYLSLKFSLCYFFVIDRQLGPISALKASSRATLGAKWQLCLFGLVCGLVNLAGFLCFGVGLLVTVPTVMIAMAHAYRQLAVQTPSLMELEADRTVVLSGVKASPQVATGFVAPAVAVAPAAKVASASGGTSSTMWVRLSILSMIIILAITAYALWPNVKGSAGISGEQESASGLTVNGIVYSDSPCAIINGRLLRPGEMIDGAQVVNIARDHVELEKSGNRWKEYVPGSKGRSTSGVAAMPKLLVLGAPRCPACRQMTPVLNKLRSGYGKDFRVEYVDVDKAGATAAKYGIRAIPTVIFCNGQGKELYRHVGYCSEDDIISLWKQLGFGF